MTSPILKLTESARDLATPVISWREFAREERAKRGCSGVDRGASAPLIHSSRSLILEISPRARIIPFSSVSISNVSFICISELS